MTPHDENKVTYFAQTDSRNKKIPFGIKRKDRSRHMYIIGKTGMGKSTLLENMAIQDIKNGEGIAFIDPHGKTADFLLDYIPPERMKDVLYFAPFDMEYPVSFNVMEDVGHDKRHLVANGLMSAFKKIWVDAWSARMEYILNNILLALLEYPESTLIGVNRMLADKEYRKKVVDNITDPSVKAFWTEEFAKYGERYMQEAGAAIQNKIGQFISNPIVRNIIGQPKSTFDLRYIMDNRKIVIINLSKGRVGEANANLLGSMIITKIYLAAMSRADADEAKLRTLPNFYLYVDEFQSFANESFADILSEARKYKLNLIMAHQYIEQMTDEVRAAVFGNVGTMIVFRIGAYDADVLEKEFFPQFTVEDLVNLGFVQIYLKLMIDGVTSPPFSATTLAPIPPPVESHKSEIVEYSRSAFAQPRAKVEEDIKKWHQSSRPEAQVPWEREETKEKREPREVREPRDTKNYSVSARTSELEKPKSPVGNQPPKFSGGNKDQFSRVTNNNNQPQSKISSALSRELDIRKAVSLNYLKPQRVEREKKEQTQKNVSALRDALASIMKAGNESTPTSPQPISSPLVDNKNEDKKENINFQKQAPSQNLNRSQYQNKSQTRNTNDTNSSLKEGKKPAELPEDVLRKMLKID